MPSCSQPDACNKHQGVVSQYSELTLSVAAARRDGPDSCTALTASPFLLTSVCSRTCLTAKSRGSIKEFTLGLFGRWLVAVFPLAEPGVCQTRVQSPPSPRVGHAPAPAPAPGKQPGSSVRGRQVLDQFSCFVEPHRYHQQQLHS